MNHPLAGPIGRPAVLGQYDSVAPVVHLMCKNPTKEEDAAVFDVSQSTMSCAWIFCGL